MSLHSWTNTNLLAAYSRDRWGQCLMEKEGERCSDTLACLTHAALRNVTRFITTTIYLRGINSIQLDHWKALQDKNIFKLPNLPDSNGRQHIWFGKKNFLRHTLLGFLPLSSYHLSPLKHSPIHILRSHWSVHKHEYMDQCIFVL